MPTAVVSLQAALNRLSQKAEHAQSIGLDLVLAFVAEQRVLETAE